MNTVIAIVTTIIIGIGAIGLLAVICTAIYLMHKKLEKSFSNIVFVVAIFFMFMMFCYGVGMLIVRVLTQFIRI